jgi:Ca-activated chloride channel family protein
MMKKSFTVFVSVFLVLSIVQNLSAMGTLFCRPRWSSIEYQKMWIKSVAVDINIQDQIAVTHVDQIFVNELNTSVEAIYIFPLPENAMMTELVYWVNGEKFIANIRERQAAINDYNRKLSQWLDPALLEYLGDNLFRLSIVPINANTEVRTEITYVEALNYDLAKVSYKFLLNTLDLSPKPLETVTVSLDAETQTSFKSFSSPTHENSSATQISAVSDSHYRLQFGDENFYPDTDLIVKFETVREYVDMRILTYTPSTEDSFGTDSYYTLWITPPDSLEDEEIIPKSLIFTVDVSSSMEGERIAQVKEALQEFLNLLNPIDRFNIVTFGTFIETFEDDLVPATEENISKAGEFVSGLYALGLTNIDGALEASLNQSFADSTSNNLVFLTDGEPTFGETNTATILENVETINIHEVRIFSFGVGETISKSFLNDLSAGNHGYAQFVTADDSIALVVNDHFFRISKPVLKNIQLDFDGLHTWDTYPKIIPDLFYGSQICYSGLYDNSGYCPVSLTGKMRTEPFEYISTINFPNSIGGHRFVPRLWAKAKIDHLLYMIDTYGENSELVDQVIELSLKFQILTRYTAFYSDPDEDDPNDPAVAIEDDQKNLPESFDLEQNFPNPFNPVTTIRYHLPTGVDNLHVKILIYDALGRLVKVLIDELQLPGSFSVTWDSKDNNGLPVPSGIYFYRIKAGQFTDIRKMVLIR